MFQPVPEDTTMFRSLIEESPSKNYQSARDFFSTDRSDRHLIITNRGAIEIICQNTTAKQVLFEITQAIPASIPGRDSVDKVSDGEIVVLVQGDGGSGVVDTSSDVCIGSPNGKFITPIRFRHQIDCCSCGIVKKPLAGGGYRPTQSAVDSDCVLRNENNRITPCQPYYN
jgi:hypothetical protein